MRFSISGRVLSVQVCNLEKSTIRGPVVEKQWTRVSPDLSAQPTYIFANYLDSVCYHQRDVRVIRSEQRTKYFSPKHCTFFS